MYCVNFLCKKKSFNQEWNPSLKLPVNFINILLLKHIPKILKLKHNAFW